MALRLPRSLVEYFLLGPDDDRRLLQDSPILGDVWIAFAGDPTRPQELLITPQRNQSGAVVAASLYERFRDPKNDLSRRKHRPSVASLHGIVSAQLDFDEVLQFVVPFTGWFERIRSRNSSSGDEATKLSADAYYEFVVQTVRQWSDPVQSLPSSARLSSLNRFLVLSGLISWAGSQQGPEFDPANRRAIVDVILKNFQPNDIYTSIYSRLAGIKGEALIHQVALNRPATMAIASSVPAIKGDAARGLFSVNCEKITWAVLDCGIKGDHLAFEDANGTSRVKRAFDFRNIQTIINLDNLRVFGPQGPAIEQKAILDTLVHADLVEPLVRSKVARSLFRLAEDHIAGRPPDWTMVTPLLEIKPRTDVRASDHGTHVAGILGARKPSAQRALARGVSVQRSAEYVDGVCPDIQLFDFRVLGNNEKSTEFAIIGALQYIDYLNRRTSQMVVHGANLSLSIRHDVKNYACGNTPVCLACERLVESGVVVVAAAGNFGHHSFMTERGAYEGYAAFSITDPGNSESVITVGSTHRNSPHTNGVSFFSSRGPTGDGRAKPDLVAPGEKIFAPVRLHWDESDGTSMAAPHVSGAAAMLLARYPELIGRPRRIKEILCKSATDLGRERSFQGFGMVDVLRAFQSI